MEQIENTGYGQLKWLWLTVFVFIFDQGSKWWALNHLTPYQPESVFPGFNWMLAFNKGAAFSFLSDSGGWQQVFFAVLALIISSILLIWIKKMQPNQNKLAAACAMVIGGALGNLLDRLYLGQVTDFIDWFYQTHHWPTFNVADSFIMLGALLIALDGIGQKSEDDERDQTADSSSKQSAKNS